MTAIGIGIGIGFGRSAVTGGGGTALAVTGALPATQTWGTTNTGSMSISGGTAPYTLSLFSGQRPPANTVIAITGSTINETGVPV